MQKQDEIAWKAALAAVEKAKSAREKMDALEVYLDEPPHQLHRVEAEQQLEKLHAAEAARKIEEKQREQQRLEAERKKRAAKQAEEERKKQEAARLAELKKQQEAEKDPLEMVLVRGGTFQMGSDDYFDAEKPIHSVTLPDFEIGKYPITQKLWREIMGNNPSQFKGDDLPVEKVSWDDCQEFLKKLNARFPGKDYRLPTEAEWEYAARGGQEGVKNGFAYAGSNNLDEVGWYDKNSGSKTHPVGQKAANAFGLYDMHGNVWEWCEDVWHDSYKSAPDDGSAWVKGGNQEWRVLRGGSWNYNADNCRSAYRNNDLPALGYGNIGVRVVVAARTQ